MRYLVLVIALLFTVDSYGQFRSTEWGDSIEEVKAAEEMEPVLEEEEGGIYTLAYTGNVANSSVLILYNFIDNKLYSGTYGFRDEFSNDNKYINEFEKIDEIITDQYGEPDGNIRSWSNDLYRDDPSEHGFAISLGHLTLQSEWQTDETDILHIMAGNNYEIRHGLYYSSLELKYLEEELEKKQNQSDF